HSNFINNSGFLSSFCWRIHERRQPVFYSWFHFPGSQWSTEREDFFFILFLFIYPITLIGNLLIILAIHSDTHLHNPMYFFLANLSFVDIFFSSVTIPKMLANHVLGSKAISFGGCLTQMCFMLALGNTDSYILAAMACDRAVAISGPLHYTTIMSPWACVLLVVGSWVV
ncbi:unnamed protein product, partial [Gulo gulo]